MRPDAVEGQATTVTHQDPSQWVDSSGSRAGLPRLVARSPHLLALEPELPDLRRNRMSAIDDLFIRLTLVVDYLPLIEPVVEQGADGTLSEGLGIAGE